MTKAVGYKHPPEQSRWKKGQSGNPTGRKKGTPNLRTDLVAELAEVIQISEGGIPRRITKQRALLKALAAKGIQGDARAANLILTLVLRLLDPEPVATSTTGLSQGDQAIVAAFLAKNASAGRGAK